MNNTLLVAISLALVAFAGNASADWSCGDIEGQYPPVAIDSCGGDTNADNPYAACDGDWRDIYVPEAGSYAQVCNDGTPHAWVCPQSYSYSYQHPNCVSA